MIKTDKHNLKYLLEQRITTPSQQKWLIKLLGFDYFIEYKKGKYNVISDALSRRDDAVQFNSISGVHSQLLEAVKQSWSQDPPLLKLLNIIQSSGVHKPYYKYHADILSRKGKLMVGANL